MIQETLPRIFEFQSQLIETLRPIEIELGYTPPQIPLDFTLRAHQDWFRLMSWYLTEEIIEAKSANHTLLPEEMADALHFAVELCILADIPPHQVLERLALEQFEPYSTPQTLDDVIFHLGLANNLLKAKHWKKNPKPTPLSNFRYHLASSLISLLQCFFQAQIDPAEEYFKKHQINNDRAQSGY